MVFFDFINIAAGLTFTVINWQVLCTPHKQHPYGARNIIELLLLFVIHPLGWNINVASIKLSQEAYIHLYLISPSICLFRFSADLRAIVIALL